MAEELITIVLIGSISVFILILAFLLFYVKYHNRLLELRIKKQKEQLDTEIRARELESEKIARNLHDQLGGNLSALSIRARTLKSKSEGNQEINKGLDNIIELLNQTHNSIRDISLDLLANDIEVYSLKYSLEKLLTHSLIENWSVKLIGINSLSLEHNISLYRVIQEILNNALKHSQSTFIKINLSFHRKTFTCEILFDGTLFNLEDFEALSNGMGLKNIKNRIQFMNCTIKLRHKDSFNLYLIEQL